MSNPNFASGEKRPTMHASVNQMPQAINHTWPAPQYALTSMPMEHEWPHPHRHADCDPRDNGYRAFHKETGYESPFYYDSDPMISPPMTYAPESGFYGSDMEIGTPSTCGFSDVTADSYFPPMTSNPATQHLPPRSSYEPSPTFSHSPTSSVGGESPYQTFARLSKVTIKQEPKPHHNRPDLFRSITAPATTHSRNNTKISNIPRSTTSSTPDDEDNNPDEDDEYVPNKEVPSASTSTSARGRKRARIPHTAVEKRYRENLNAHLDRLRQNVPALMRDATTVNDSGGSVVVGVKPSKCEVLNGAIEHIVAQAREIQGLRDEVEGMRRWVEMGGVGGYRG